MTRFVLIAGSAIPFIRYFIYVYSDHVNTVFSKEQADILMSWAISILIAVTLCSVKNFYDTYIVKERQAFGFASRGWAYYKMFVRPKPYIFQLLASCLVNK